MLLEALRFVAEPGRSILSISPGIPQFTLSHHPSFTGGLSQPRLCSYLSLAISDLYVMPLACIEPTNVTLWPDTCLVQATPLPWAPCGLGRRSRARLWAVASCPGKGLLDRHDGEQRCTHLSGVRPLVDT